jgi:transmembrane sensor
MAQDKAMIEAAALDWIIRQRDPDFDDWDGFTAWLEADARHAELYQAMAAADADMGPLVEQAQPSTPASIPLPIPANDPGRPSRRLWIGGAIAASLVAATSIGLLLPRSDPWQIETRPGERRELALADGSKVILNGGTRITLDHGDPRVATLDHGEALFIVSHNADDPFEVKAGAAHLVDIGTAFNVVRDGATLDVAVSEGAVLYNPDGEAARIDAGHRLHAVDGEDSYQLTDVDNHAVAGWREGRLVYDGQPLANVAADLARYYGLRVTVAPSLSARKFRGVLTLPHKGEIAALAPVLDVAITGRNGEWTLSSPQ